MNKLGLYINNLMSTIQNTDEKPFDYLSGTDHLGCVLEKENNEENQMKLEFKDE